MRILPHLHSVLWDLSALPPLEVFTRSLKGIALTPAVISDLYPSFLGLAFGDERKPRSAHRLQSPERHHPRRGPREPR